jgi:hypothetical protein
MNVQHLRAFLWLRWRLLVNQWRRSGRLNAVLMMIISFCAVAIAVPLFIGCLWLGLYAIPKATPLHLLAVWDAIVVVFLFFWSIGLLTELQRSEPLALSKFMHLPVSVTGAFLINYMSSLLSLSLVFFVPVMLAYALALVIVKGPVMLPSLAGLLAFLLMVTALNYQFRGWVASLMSNPRRKRTVIAAATGFFILVTQLPNIVNAYAPWGNKGPVQDAEYQRQQGELLRLLQAGKIRPAELDLRRQKLEEEHRARIEEANRQTLDRWTRTARLVNMVLPIGWLPLGVSEAAEGNVLPSLLGSAGMGLIGAASLRWAYKGTIALYQGAPTNQRVPASASTGKPPVLDSDLRPPLKGAQAARPSGPASLLEARLPGLSEPVSAVALGGFRSLTRAPEARMILLSSLIMIVFFGSFLMRGDRQGSEWNRPLVGIGAMMVVLFSLSNVMANQFGFDRDGFRVFVLSAARRRDILLGKNLALAPLVMMIATLVLVVIQLFRPVRLDHLIALVPQFVSMYLLDCILMNLLSIYAPIHIPSGSLRPANPTVSTVLLQLVTLLLLLPMIQSLTLIPLGAEFLMELFGQSWPLPVCLILTILECGLIVLVYLASLNWQGRLLQQREKIILERVTARAE